MKVTVSGVEIEIVQGNIVSQSDITAIVNAANAMLRSGGGVAGAIHNEAGPGLEKESRELAPIKPGEAVITGGYNLPNKYVIHCLGPVYGVNNPAEKLLASCYKNALKIAEEYKIESIAFPAISTGIFGYPLEEAAQIAIKTIIEKVYYLNNVKKIRLVLYDSKALNVHSKVLAELA